MQESTLLQTAAQTPLSHVEHRYDVHEKTFWYFMNPATRPCFSPKLLSELQYLQRKLIQQGARDDGEAAEYSVLASKTPGIFNLGGDLELFIQLIETRDVEALRRYAYTCIDLCYHQYINLNYRHTTVALVQGNALGGGFEAALACSVIIAERHAQFGFPEILFNLFPGMGAYSFLARKLDPSRAKRIIESGQLYAAEELYAMGVIDVLVDTDEGIEATCDYITRHRKTRNSRLAMQRVHQIYHPLEYDELSEIVDVWVEATLRLGVRDLKFIERLIRSQDRHSKPQPPRALAEARASDKPALQRSFLAPVQVSL